MLRGIASILGKSYLTIIKIRRRMLSWAIRPLFKKCGKNLRFDPLSSNFTFNNISIGDDVMIGARAMFIAALSHITIGNKVMFAPNVTIRGGNHNTRVIGKYMLDVRDKLPEDDQPVVIEDDVWVGTNVTILSGVTIGRGSIIAAGSVLTRNVRPYSVVAGVPAKFVKWRWDLDEICSHEKILYLKKQRFTRVFLEQLREI